MLGRFGINERLSLLASQLLGLLDLTIRPINEPIRDHRILQLVGLALNLIRKAE